MMGRPPCCDEAGLKKGPWTTEEDQKLVDYISKNGHGSWSKLPKLAGLNRCGKSCRLRWTNYLRPDIKRGRFSEEEERQIIELHSHLGNKWSAIATHLHGRTDNEIKNYWNTHIRRKLIRMGIDPVTHQPKLDLSFLANLPNLPASLPLDGVFRLQAEAAQLARVQLLQTLLQVLACAGGSTDIINAPAMDSTGIMGPGFLHNHGLLNLNSMAPLQVPNQTANLHNSHQSIGGEEFVSLVTGASNSNMFPDHVENNSEMSNSMPSLVSSSPENLAVVKTEELQNLNHNMPTSLSATTMCESLDFDDLFGEFYWKEVFDHASSPTWPFPS